MRDWTEGVGHNVSWPFLRRNIPKDVDDEDLGKVFLPVAHDESLTVRVSPNNYRLIWDKGTSDWWVHDRIVQMRGLSGMQSLKDERKAKFEERFVKNENWKNGLSKEEVRKTEAAFATEPYDKPAAAAEGVEEKIVEAKAELEDEAMADA